MNTVPALGFLRPPNDHEALASPGFMKARYRLS
jgi:hypothetical protein